MTDVDESARTHGRPGTVVAAAVLSLVVALHPLGQLVLVLSIEHSPGVLVPWLVGAVATSACWVAIVPGLLRGRAWAQVAVTAMSAVTVAQGLPTAIGVVGLSPDLVLLAYAVAVVTPLAIIAAVWSRRARAWFGPLR